MNDLKTCILMPLDIRNSPSWPRPENFTIPICLPFEIFIFTTPLSDNHSLPSKCIYTSPHQCFWLLDKDIFPVSCFLPSPSWDSWAHLSVLSWKFPLSHICGCLFCLRLCQDWLWVTLPEPVTTPTLHMQPAATVLHSTGHRTVSLLQKGLWGSSTLP